MAINRYHQPILAEYISLYAPIPFQELMVLGKEYATLRREAEELLASNIKTFGKFISPSKVDMENYNKETIGKFTPLIEEAAANPNLMKSPAFRARLQNAYNTIDYAKVGMLELSAANLRAGLEMRAKMEAEGLYNKDWDLSDIPNYDTLQSRAVFSDISPVKYMTANELSNKYFDNLKAGDLGPVWRDGVKYRAIGNSPEDLETIYDRYENDLINSPQGKAYMRQFTAARNGNVEEARKDFRSMILASQMDRTLRPNLQVDQGWLLLEKARIARSVGTQEVNYTAPTRQQQIGSDIANNVINKVGKLPQNVEKNVNMHILAAQGYAEEYEEAKTRYAQSGSDEDLIYMNLMHARAQQEMLSAQSYPIRLVMRDAFKKTANFDLYKSPKNNENYNRANYVAGAKSAVQAISNTTSLNPISEGGDPLLTRVGGTPQEYTLKSGAKSSVYEFNNTSNFLLPESILQLATDTEPVSVIRKSSWLRSNENFEFRHALESGRFTNVHFIPNSSNNTFLMGGTDNENHKYINGKLRIPAEQIRETFGTGALTGYAVPDYFPLIFGTTSVTDMMREHFNASTVKYGEDGNEYFEIDASYRLPADSDNDYWYDINQLRENSPSAGGVGGASQAEQQRIATLQSLMLQ